MKKLLAAILMFAMLLTSAAFAETESTAPLLSMLDDIGQAEMYEHLAREWRHTLLMFNDGLCQDAEMITSLYAVQINDDATMTVKTYGMEDQVYPLKLTYRDSAKDIMIEGRSKNGDSAVVLYFTKFSDLHSDGWNDYCLLVYAFGYYHLFFNTYEIAPDPAPVLTDISIEDFDGKWALKENSSMGRQTQYTKDGYSFVEGAVMTKPGMICELNSAAGTANIDYQTNLNYQSDKNDADFVYEESFENGELKLFSYSYGFMNEDGTYSSSAVCRLHEDGTLSVENLGMRMIFEKYVIDPLTEYTDKAIVKTVQEAMNYLGHECGTPDGISGKKTKAAISAYQAENGLTETGTVTEELLECLRGLGYSF